MKKNDGAMVSFLVRAPILWITAVVISYTFFFALTPFHSKNLQMRAS